jgi:hypothetical protein
MSEGKFPDLSMYAPRIQELVKSGAIPYADAAWMNEYSKTKGDSRVETGKGAFKDHSEKFQNFINRMKSGEIATPPHFKATVGGGGGGGGIPKVGPKRPTDMKKGGKVSNASKRADGCAIRGKTRA